MPIMLLRVFFFFFQAEDGIRDLTVTGVQTCALPIWTRLPSSMTALSGKRKKWEALPDRRLMPTKTWLLQWDRPCPFSATSVGWLRNQLACSDAVSMPGMSSSARALGTSRSEEHTSELQSQS